MNSYGRLSKKELIKILESRDSALARRETTNVRQSPDFCTDNESPAHPSLLKTVLNTIDEPIYIVDLESDRIIFANKKVDALYGPLLGEYCWNKLQEKQSGICEICTNHYLLDKKGHPTGVHQSMCQSTLTEKWFQCSDQAFEWEDGRMVAIKTAVDVSALKEATLSMHKLLEQNKNLTKNIVLSIDNERRCLSNDLHDEIGQLGTGIRLNADFLRLQETGDKLAAADDIIRLSQQLLNTVRNISYRLNPRSLILNLTVYEMLQRLFGEWAKRNRNIDSNIDFDFDLNLDLNIALKEMLYRVMQEALTNVSRHAKATQVSVVCSVSKKDSKKSKSTPNNKEDIQPSTHFIDLTITDNGVGFPKKQNGACLGSIYMEERVNSLSGQLNKGMAPDGGAQIHVVVPCHATLKGTKEE